MKFLFCGLGSIGERHLSNLLSLGETEISAYRKTHVPLRTITQKIKTYNTLSEAIKQKPQAAFITNPSALHIPLALQLAKSNCHLFIEKPLSTTMENLKKLERIVKNKKLIVQVGFMMRYHPAMKQIKKWLQEGIIGDPVCARVCWGEYLPSWHPWENYKNSYSAKTNLGGGPIFTLCHDVDLMSWFFGKPKTVYALANKNSSLDIPTEHCAEIVFQYKRKLIVEIHLDYLQLPPKRSWEIIGSKGRIELDYYKNLLKLYIVNSDRLTFQETSKEYSDTFERNDMFFEEVKSFIDALNEKKEPEISLRDGINNVELLTAIHSSIKSKSVVNI